MGIGVEYRRMSFLYQRINEKELLFPFLDKTVARLAINKKHRQAKEQDPGGDICNDNSDPYRNHIQKNWFDVT